MYPRTSSAALLSPRSHFQACSSQAQWQVEQAEQQLQLRSAFRTWEGPQVCSVVAGCARLLSEAAVAALAGPGDSCHCSSRCL